MDEIEILRYEPELKVKANLAMVLAETRRRGKMIIRTGAGEVFKIELIEPTE